MSVMRAAVPGLLLSVLPLCAAGQEARATLEADLTEVTVGDRIAVTVTVEHAADQSVLWPDSIALPPFEVLGAAAAPPRIEGDRAVTSATLSLAAFELGELEIPSLQLALVKAAGEEAVVATDPFVVGVVSIGLDEGDEIRDVKGPLGIPRNWILLWPWLLAALAVGGLCYWLARRRGMAESPPRPVAPPRAPYDVAIDALVRLEGSNLLERGQVKDFHIAVSQIVRAYVEGRFEIDALEMTSGELLTALNAAGLTTELLDQTRRFLDACDLVKFAKRRPTESESRALIPVARDFVEQTKPAEPVADEAGQTDEAEEAA